MTDFLTRRAGELRDRYAALLADHDARRRADPEANPVKLLALEISRDIESGETSLKQLDALAKRISDEALLARAKRLARRSGSAEIGDLEKAFDALAVAHAKKGFDAFRRWAETPGLGVVLTGHPTFAMSRALRAKLVAAAAAPEAGLDQFAGEPHAPDAALTLLDEHAQCQETLIAVQAALRGAHARVLAVAAAHFPERWFTLAPRLVTAASWVGYDLDGRTDISWFDAIRFRLNEKAAQLARYAEAARALSQLAFSRENVAEAADFAEATARAAASAEKDAARFADDLEDEDALIAAANGLTEPDPDRWLSTAPALARLAALLPYAEDDDARRAIALMRSDMASFGLGTAGVHLRVNAEHIRSAVRATLPIEEGRYSGRTTLAEVADLVRKTQEIEINFGSLALEQGVARRQVMLAAQILKHVDADAPIRLLIAECEHAATILGALHLARRYGVEDKLDISPLFETPSAIRLGGRVLETALDQPDYLDYVRARGRIAIQNGFSDAGRYMGQVAADLAIERIQSHLAQRLAERGLGDIEAVVFNTHGESLGRGGHPGSIADRARYVLSPWVARRLAEAGAHLVHETSFQGGDGFAFLQSPELARATLTGLIVARWSDVAGADDDPFYADTDFTWDVYSAIAQFQEALNQDRDYGLILGDFAQAMLCKTGSRPVRRQRDAGPPTPGQIRAIPHNAILQQLGFPANVVSGLGAAARVNADRFVDFARRSDRLRRVLGLVDHARRLARLEVLHAYADTSDPGFWIARSATARRADVAERALAVAESLHGSDWRDRVRRLAHRLRIDLLSAPQRPDAADQAPETLEARTRLRLLHAVRVALIMHMLLTAARLPPATMGMIPRARILERLHALQAEEALDDLREAYPARRASAAWVERLAEDADAPPAAGDGDPHVNDAIITPIEQSLHLIRRIAVGVSHEFDAIG